MQCKKCIQRAVSEKHLCKKHFIDYFEKTVNDTIKKYRLINKNDKIICAASGGKDSTTAIYLIKKFFPKNKIMILAIDEGIEPYRDQTLTDLREFCRRNKLLLKIVSFKQEFGFRLDEAIKKISINPCNACGVLRRNLLNKHSKAFTKLVTGHNLDDEAQSILMNLLKNNIEALSRLGPVTGIREHKHFVRRVKPLYFCTEKETRLYTLLKGIDAGFTECPHAADSFRQYIRKHLNELEFRQRGAKLNLINNFLKLMPRLKAHYQNIHKHKSILQCSICREPSQGSVCRACMTVGMITNS